MTTTLVPVAGGRLHVVDEGSRSHPPIVLLHAGIADLRSWDDLATRLVVAGYRVIRFDGRGHGRSTTEDVDFSQRADLVAVIDGVGVERAVLVGNSRGGQVALDTAIEHPHRVIAIVGVGTRLGGFDGASTPAEMALFEEMDALETAAEPDPAKIADIDVRVWVERLGELRCPVLAVAGDLDVSDVAQTANHLAAHAPNARAIVWPHVAHMIGMEVPDEFAAVIIDFLAPLPRWS